ncbi:hypothetical protein EVAR_32456_1 [Eumeta japonica]|uniref:Uncharacterized protein n=1 Tax=Eumeta variegata TaxID=151549 RepID=A0A4C1VM93_EUMVA|nr:hypothetical protein EVAR_32456_1 [Eumeta japonica]
MYCKTSAANGKGHHVRKTRFSRCRTAALPPRPLVAATQFKNNVFFDRRLKREPRLPQAPPLALTDAGPARTHKPSHGGRVSYCPAAAAGSLYAPRASGNAKGEKTPQRESPFISKTCRMRYTGCVARDETKTISGQGNESSQLSPSSGIVLFHPAPHKILLYADMLIC